MKPVLGIVLGSILLGLVTAPLLQHGPEGQAVDDVRAAHGLLALKSGCYLVQVEVSPETGGSIAALQNRTVPGLQDAVTVLVEERRGVETVVFGEETVIVFGDGTRRQATPGTGAVIGVAVDAPLLVRTGFLKRAGDNICEEP